MKKVLLTNFNMINYSGSELDTLTIANYFLQIGFDVTIFTLKVGYPLLNDINSKIKIVECVNVDKLDDRYDLVWAHHYPLLDYLLFSKKIKFCHIAYVSLSSYEPYETIPPYYKYLDYVSILSKEGMDVLSDDGYDVSKIDLLGNYSFERYFKNRKKKLNKEIKKMCVISNHVPQEIEECAIIAKKHNICFDIFGINHTYVKVDDKLLKKYDVIITIGKTVNYGLSLGIPVYCYDYFGGDGYITKDNIIFSHDYNFSGRYTHKKMRAIEIFDDLTKNYKNALCNIDYNFEYAFQNFHFENRMKRIVSKIFKSNNIKLGEMLNNFKIYGKSSILFVREMIKNNEVQKYSKSINKCKIYFDYGNDFVENDANIYYYKLNEEIIYDVRINLKKGIKRIKFDFADCEFAGLVEIKVNNRKIKINHFINTIRVNNLDISFSKNPSVIIYDLTPGKNFFEIKINMISAEEILRYANELECQIIKLNEMIKKTNENKLIKILKKLRIIK